MIYRRNNEDILNPQRTFYRLLRDYTEGKLKQRRVFYRAIVIASAKVEGELEKNPPCPVGSVRARIYTHGMDINIPNEALTIFYPLFPGDVPQPGEHVYVMFEDENMSSGLWVSKIPNYTDINLANPDLNPPPSVRDSSQKFEGQDASIRIPSEAQYRAIPLNSERQQETVNAFEEQENSIWSGKRVLLIGDSMIHGPPGLRMQQGIQNRGGIMDNGMRDGRVGWGVIHWLLGRHSGRSRFIPRSGPKLPELISIYNPDIVVIGLGGNDWAQSDLERYREKVEQLWEQASRVFDRYWVGPPDAFPTNKSSAELERFRSGRFAVERVISSVVGSNFIKVSDVTNTREGRASDGIHFTSSGVPDAYIERVVNR